MSAAEDRQQEPQRRHWGAWLGIAFGGLLLVYVLCVGPVAAALSWLIADPSERQRAAVRGIFWPHVVLAERWRPYMEYIMWWERQGRRLR